MLRKLHLTGENAEGLNGICAMRPLPTKFNVQMPFLIWKILFTIFNYTFLLLTLTYVSYIVCNAHLDGVSLVSCVGRIRQRAPRIQHVA